MTTKFTRRQTLNGGLAIGVTTALPLQAQGILDVKFTGFATDVAGQFPPASSSVANCGVLADEVTRVQNDIATVDAASDVELDSQIRQIFDALDVETGALSNAIAETQDAISANDANIEKAAIQAFRNTNDLILATAVQSRNPQFVGAAVGVHILADTGFFAYQAITAPPQSTKVEKAIVTLVKGRKQMYTVFKTGPGVGLAKKQAKMATSLMVAVARVAKGSYQASALRSDLTKLENDLQALDKNSAGLPNNSAETRPYFRARLEAELELYELINTSLSPSDCLISQPVIINPLG